MPTPRLSKTRTECSLASKATWGPQEKELLLRPMINTTCSSPRPCCSDRENALSLTRNPSKDWPTIINAVTFSDIVGLSPDFRDGTKTSSYTCLRIKNSVQFDVGHSRAKAPEAKKLPRCRLYRTLAYKVPGAEFEIYRQQNSISLDGAHYPCIICLSHSVSLATHWIHSAACRGRTMLHL